MKTKIISLLVIIAFAVVSCQKDEADKPVVQQDVEFGIERIDPNLLKDDADPYKCPSNLDAVKAEITIAGIQDPFVVDLFWVDDKMYTQAIKLASGSYTVTDFILLDANDDFVMAIPAENSEYAEYLTGTEPKTVPFEFTVGAFTKVEIPVEVLCFLPSVYDKFGFFWFNITEIVIREFCFFGDVCANGVPYVPASFGESLYELVPGGLAVDMPAIFEVRVFAADGTTPVPAQPVGANVFSNVSFDEQGNPIVDATRTVCAKFPDKLRTPGEAGFKMELWVLIPDGQGGFTYHLFTTFDVVEDANGVWDIQLNNTSALNEFNAVDFAIGTCSPFSTHIFPYPGN